MNLMRGINLKAIAEKMGGASGAESKVLIPPLMFHFLKILFFLFWKSQSVCTEAGMFALRERRIHVTQEDFEMSVAKVMKKDLEKNMAMRKLWTWIILIFSESLCIILNCILVILYKFRSIYKKIIKSKLVNIP